MREIIELPKYAVVGFGCGVMSPFEELEEEEEIIRVREIATNQRNMIKAFNVEEINKIKKNLENYCSETGWDIDKLRSIVNQITTDAVSLARLYMVVVVALRSRIGLLENPLSDKLENYLNSFSDLSALGRLINDYMNGSDVEEDIKIIMLPYFENVAVMMTFILKEIKIVSREQKNEFSEEDSNIEEVDM